MHTCLKVKRLISIQLKMMAANSSSLSKILYHRIIDDSKSDAGPFPNVEGSSEHCSDGKRHCSTPNVTEIRGVIFDMDGTLTLPVLNFAEMRSRLNLTPNQDILPTVQKYPPKERAQAMAIIEECEDEALAKLQVRKQMIIDLLGFLIVKLSWQKL